MNRANIILSRGNSGTLGASVWLVIPPRKANTGEIQRHRRNAHNLKEAAAEQALALRMLKKIIGNGEDIE